MSPLILVTTTQTGDGDRMPAASLATPYIVGIERPGATALLVTPAHRSASRERLLDMADALMLSGGEDIAPQRYGAEPGLHLGIVNHERDEMELEVLRGALERGMPILGICRGMQLLNVALGGTLIQDLPSEKGGEIRHKQEGSLLSRTHLASVEPGSRLHGIFGNPDFCINSFHHQALDRVAAPLRVVARAEDGIVEAVESAEHPWLCGVQWHPERGEAELMEDPRDPDRRLLWAFVDAARGYAAGRQS